MIQITPQMRILVAVESVDFRKYAPSMVMRSCGVATLQNWPFCKVRTAHNGRYFLGRSMASNLSGGRKRPRRKVGGTKEAMASSFSAGSALT
jgi:hypothetical protein